MRPLHGSQTARNVLAAVIAFELVVVTYGLVWAMLK